MVLIDFQGWAKADGQARQHICPLHEQERLAINFLGGTETDREQGQSRSPLRPKKSRVGHSPALGKLLPAQGSQPP